MYGWVPERLARIAKLPPFARFFFANSRATLPISSGSLEASRAELKDTIPNTRRSAEDAAGTSSTST